MALKLINIRWIRTGSPPYWKIMYNTNNQIISTSVPKVLVHCAEFIEKRGIVDGIYRLSGMLLVSVQHPNYQGWQSESAIKIADSNY